MEVNAVEKSIQRHKQKLAIKKKPTPPTPIPWGCGMGWPEPHDFDSREEYIKARMKADPEYSSAHDGRLWLMPG